MSILAAILGFNVLILVHELGHYLLARLCRMRVVKFSLGFGPSIVSIQGRTAQFSIGLLPLGGYVHIAGMGARADEPTTPDTFQARPLWQRTLVVAAGPIFNVLLAAALYVYLFGSFHALRFEMVPAPTTVIQDVTGPAKAAGLQPWDTIVDFDGQPIRTFRDIQSAVGASEGRPIAVGVVRPPAGERPAVVPRALPDLSDGLQIADPKPDAAWPRLVINVTPQKTARGYMLGIAPDLARFGADSLTGAVRLGVREAFFATADFVRSIGRMLIGREKAEVASIVKITEIGADTVKMGFADWFITLMALLSINVALINLLPVPGLDGGRLIFLAVEAIARKPVPRRIENMVHGVGMLVLLGLILFVTIGEIAQHF